MSSLMPQVPPRPNKAVDHNQNTSSTESPGSELPKVPPRPLNKRIERSISHQESYAQSPLNVTPSNHGSQCASSPQDSKNANASGIEIRRPSSVNLPSLGQEGIEYADAYEVQEEGSSKSPIQFRNIDKDLKLYAPKPALSDSNARRSVSTVTRTDSSQAAAYGLGKAKTSNYSDSSSRSLHSVDPENCPSSISSEHGIPQIGQTVPMYPNAGDVQAPSPAPSSATYVSGLGLYNDGTKPRHHGRKLSARDHDIPPDSYGRYGHGIIPQDRFDKAYYKKHPELFKKELGSYGDARPEWALSSDDLNKIVRDTASHGTGVGVSPASIGTPSEQIGFQASEEYASRLSSPRPPPRFHMANSNETETQDDSLNNENSTNHLLTQSTVSDQQQCSSNFVADVDHSDIIHVDNLAKRDANGQGDFGHSELSETPGSNVNQEKINDDHGYGAPILASDEVAKEPLSWKLEPAVSLLNENAISLHENSLYPQNAENKTNSIDNKSAYISSNSHETPLEDLNEYEPLFPEEEKTNFGENDSLDPLKKIERSEMRNRKFPSRDVWEDTPNSLQYTATVSTPQFPEEEKEQGKAECYFETAAQAFARRHEELAEQEMKGAETIHQEKAKKNRVEKHEKLMPVTKPKLSNPRFPSRDIWEDAPDSLLLQTTVAGPQVDKDTINTPEEQQVPNLVNGQNIEGQTGLSSSENVCHGEAKLVPVVESVSVSIPRSSTSDSQEQSRTGSPKQSPNLQTPSASFATSPIITKPKPQVPVRPSKILPRESSETHSPSQVTSNTMTTSKSKPAVPSRPMGTKIAALQGGFMSDLSKRLQLGPQTPKKEEAIQEKSEIEKDKIPLVDARKSRTRGPVRRAPGKSLITSSTTQECIMAPENLSLGLSTTLTIWSIDPVANHLYVTPNGQDKEARALSADPLKSQTPITDHVKQSSIRSCEVADEKIINMSNSSE